MTLRTWQTEAIAAAERALVNGERAVIQAIMGAGKSVVIAELAGRAFRRGLHVVITVPTQELVRQLAGAIERWTGQVVGQWYADARDLWPITVVCQASIATYEIAWRAKYVAEEWQDQGDGWLEKLPNVPKRLWLADEAHRTECDTMLAWDAPTKRVGVSATPWRAEMSGTISAFDSVCYEYGAERAHADGHVVKPTLHHLSGGDVDAEIAEWVAMARQKWGGGVVNARSIADAAEFARQIGAVAVHSEGEADATMAREVIRGGGVVVYVDMLAEGFDCPEIAWMALRRPVGSRVRFAQEVGRGLRAAEGKTTCHMLDVWDLWGTHSMTWQAALGERDSVPVPALQLDLVAEQTEWTGRDQAEPMPPELLGPLRSWLRHERVQALFDGRIEAKDVRPRSWRSDPCSRKQLEYLDSLMRRLSPAELDPGTVRRVRLARAALVDCLGRDAGELQGAFRKGDASDLIDVVRGMR